jgi:hypothetical protein
MKFKAAMQTDQDGWSVAVEEEYHLMVDNNVFKIIHRKDVPRGHKVIRTTWAMKQKVNNQRSVMSCEVFLEDCCTSAKSKQMPFVTLSVTEAELAAAVECAQDLMYSMHVLEGMGLHVSKPMPLYVDNEAAVNMVRNWISGGRMCHTAVRLNFLRELQEAGMIDLRHVAGHDNPADIGSKNTNRTTFEQHGVCLHGKDEYYKEFMKTLQSANPKWEGVTGVALDADNEFTGVDPDVDEGRPDVFVQDAKSPHIGVGVSSNGPHSGVSVSWDGNLRTL